MFKVTRLFISVALNISRPQSTESEGEADLCQQIKV